MTWDWRQAADSEGRVKKIMVDEEEGKLTWDLARGMCDSSSHINLMPHDDQRPCSYHLQRAVDTLQQIRNRNARS